MTLSRLGGKGGGKREGEVIGNAARPWKSAASE